jgi:predicted AlkP superfamily pyrophosphatase or phosphodiesterase
MDKFLFPNYKENNILNFVASLLEHFGANYSHEPLNNINISKDNVIVFLLDAVGYYQFREICKNYKPIKLSTVFPSTTATALTSFFTEKSPIEHGVLGFTTYLNDYGIIANCISMKSTIGNFDVSKYFYQESIIFEQLSKLNVKSRVLIPHSISSSGLSKILYRGADIIPYYSFLDMFTILPSILTKEDRGNFITVYYPNYDTICHKYGPHSIHAKNELKLLVEHIMEISKKINNYNIFLIADHGQIQTPSEHFNFWNNYPHILKKFIIPPFCEPRVNMFFESENINKTLTSTFKNILLLTKEEALNKEIFGLGEKYSNRLGNKIMIALDDSVFMSQLSPTTPPPTFLGMHGSNSEEEIYIPLLQIK